MAQIPTSVLIIIDGFGFNPEKEGNAIYHAKTPNLDFYWSSYPHTLLKAAEEEVGLSFGQIGNSEVGHMAIGSGRVVPSPLERINLSLENSTFSQNKAFLEAFEFAKQKGTKLHIIGMISSSGVHAELKHFIKILEIAKRQNLNKIYLHPILDGRDTGPKDAKIYLTILESARKKIKAGVIATIGGRAFAMDRNNNWNLTKKYYDVLVGNSEKSGKDYFSYINDAYNQGYDDENMPPTIISKEGCIQHGDSVIVTNFRSDRVRQISHALADTKFLGFERAFHPKDLFIVTMTEY